MSNSGGTYTGFPAAMNGVVAVRSTTPDGTLSQPNIVSNDIGITAGESLLGYAPGRKLGQSFTRQEIIHGNSFASPITAAALALAVAEWPDATSNQILQLLATTATPLTGAPGVHTDDSGFGALNPYAMLTTDPTGLPDTNPFLRDDRQPSIAELAGYAETTSPSIEPTTTEPSTTAADPAQPDTTNPTWWIIIGVAALTAIVLTVLTRIRSRTRTQERI